ncbi:MAG TPA: hypothetical protein VK674_06375 [Candidatus Limnocylindria bacterium]|nr:hypothetical protein [Candidatus Limnocylindria bacterium]
MNADAVPELLTLEATGKSRHWPGLDEPYLLPVPDQERAEPYRLDGFTVATQASNWRQFENSLRRVGRELDLDLDADDDATRRQKSVWFNAIDRGRRAEPVLAGLLASGESDMDRMENLQDIVAMGCNTRKIIVMGYAVRAVAELKPNKNDEAPWPGDDRAQTQLLKLCVAVTDFAGRPEEKRRDKNFWDYTKDRMHNIKFSDFEEVER